MVINTIKTSVNNPKSSAWGSVLAPFLLNQRSVI